MRTFIKELLRHCRECQLIETGKPIRSEELHPLNPVTPFKRWSLDFIGRLPKSRYGNCWILVAVDHCTKWPIAKAFQHADTITGAKFIYEEIFMTFGCPSEILTDRGSQFMAEVLESYLHLQKVRHLRTSAFHPRTNGLVERLNGFLQNMLMKYTVSHSTRWDEFLSQALFAARIRSHSATKQSPFKLTYGVEPVIPGDTTKPFIFDDRDPEDMLEIRISELESLGQIRAAALERAHLNAMRMKNSYDIKVRDVKFAIGDYVWIKRPVALKMEPRYEGPLQILNCCSMGTFQLIHPNGEIKKDLVHKDRIKHADLSPEEKDLFGNRCRFIVEQTKQILLEGT